MYVVQGIALGLGTLARSHKNTKKGNFSSWFPTLGPPPGTGVRMLDRRTMFSQLPKWKLKRPKAQVTQAEHSIVGAVGVSVGLDSIVAEGGAFNGRQREPVTRAAPNAAQRPVDHKAAHKGMTRAWRMSDNHTHTARRELHPELLPQPGPKLADNDRLWCKPINVSHAAALSDNAEAWQAVLRRGAEVFLERHDTVHAGLHDFDGVHQAPSPRGHCIALAHPHESCLARRLSELIAGILEMLIVHRSVLSPTAYENSITYVTLPLLVDKDSGEELVARFFLDGLLPRPECGGRCPAAWQAQHHDTTEHGDPMMPPGAGYGHTYNAWLWICLNKSWRALVSQGTFPLGEMVTLLIRFGMAAAMGYTRPAAWERAWGGQWGGNIHATSWFSTQISRALNCNVTTEELVHVNFGGYGDGPSLSVSAHVTRPARAYGEKSTKEAVNAAQLQLWLWQGAERDDSLQWERCRARFCVQTMPAWQRVLSALHRDTIIVADFTSWWRHSEWSTCFDSLSCALAACGERKTATDTSQPSAWTNPLMRAPTMVISFRETAGTSRGNAGDALAWVGVHAVDVRPLRHRDDIDARRPVLAMHMVNGKQGAEGHMVACSQPPWHNGVSSIFDIVSANMHAMGVEWGVIDGQAAVPLDATQCVKNKHRHWVAALTTVSMPVLPPPVASSPPTRKVITRNPTPDCDRLGPAAKTHCTRSGSK